MKRKRINISISESVYEEAKRRAKNGGFASVTGFANALVKEACSVERTPQAEKGDGVSEFLEDMFREFEQWENENPPCYDGKIRKRL